MKTARSRARLPAHLGVRLRPSRSAAHHREPLCHAVDHALLRAHVRVPGRRVRLVATCARQITARAVAVSSAAWSVARRPRTDRAGIRLVDGGTGGIAMAAAPSYLRSEPASSRATTFSIHSRPHGWEPSPTFGPRWRCPGCCATTASPMRSTTRCCRGSASWPSALAWVKCS